jgi:hypothetical protein
LGSHYEDCLPKLRAGAERVPDFVLERTDGLYEVIEIKQPGLPLFVRNSGNLIESAELKRALSQLFDYLDYYKTHYLSESKIHSRDFKVTGGRLVMGRVRKPSTAIRIAACFCVSPINVRPVPKNQPILLAVAWGRSLET